MTQTTATGIAGAADHTPSRATTCHVCGSDMETPNAMRSMPGVGVVGACSRACAAADGFRTPHERAVAEIDAILRGRHDGWDRALAGVRGFLSNLDIEPR